MVHAFVMVKAGAGEAGAVARRVRDLDTVTQAHVVAGEYDVIAEVDAEEVYGVLDAVASGIQSLPGVTDTKTYVSMDD
ncbi:Lrp/AsnC ligand binding domain-containing protein [Halorarum salinum]|uniref:Lrp/AsnC ligand binding domain-containing protein n=1 Tax=Halorarum salinum TaxID=2743089 RepID=A0A7D5QFI3_9EURY|nr:Lrp/AsnC ligand binding domain-containing protein [Halobaculum salinum]QLG61463.1 Lrp/AsnC ligand binding domain-containing protein [Halobaculum salinum]